MSTPPNPYGPPNPPGPQGPYGQHGPTPGLPPGMAPPPPKRNKGKFWLGVVLALPALLVAAFVFGAVLSLVSSAGAPGELTSTAGAFVVLAVLAGLITLIVVEKTRWVGLGLVAGAAIWAIIAAGACIALLTSLSNSYNA